MIGAPLYWDSSAVLALLLRENRGALAEDALASGDLHFRSSLTLAETYATLARVERAQLQTPEGIARAYEAFARAGWSDIPGQPDRILLRSLAARYALRGADLWHLSLAKTLHAELPELRLLTFDERLAAAAQAEGLAA